MSGALEPDDVSAFDERVLWSCFTPSAPSPRHTGEATFASRTGAKTISAAVGRRGDP
jgi:hypothetical protein